MACARAGIEGLGRGCADSSLSRTYTGLVRSASAARRGGYASLHTFTRSLARTHTRTCCFPLAPSLSFLYIHTRSPLFPASRAYRLPTVYIHICPRASTAYMCVCVYSFLTLSLFFRVLALASRHIVYSARFCLRAARERAACVPDESAAAAPRVVSYTCVSCSAFRPNFFFFIQRLEIVDRYESDIGTRCRCFARVLLWCRY